MANIFNSIQARFKKRNKFDLSHESRLTTEFGRLTPILCEPVLPNDRFSIATTLKVQFAPMVFPVMQKFSAYVHYFFVPNRLLWDKWEDFITGGDDGLQEPSYPVIQFSDEFIESVEDLNFNNVVCGPSSLWDYLGFPSIDPSDGLGRNHDFDALPFKAYQLIYNEWYRDQNLESEFEIHSEMSGIQDNDDDHAFEFGLLSLRNRAWRKDYFTSALPDPQRGPDVTLPLVGDSEIDITFKSNPLGTVLRGPGIFDGDNLESRTSGAQQDTVGYIVATDGSSSRDVPLQVDNSENLQGNLRFDDEENGIRSATINEVRRAFAIQRWYELAARAGSRYIEQIFAHFGIRSSDARLQRPEFIGGGVVPVYIGDVLQTSETQETPLGTPAGVGQAMGSCRLKKRYMTFEEHGWIIGILSIIPQAAYFQGIPRKFLKRDKFDFAWPLLANLGEQEIESQELVFNPSLTKEQNKQGFGYTPRYAEYKYGAGQVHGDFRDSLLDFHDARVFDGVPHFHR